MTIAPTPRFDELSPEESRRALAGLRPGLPVFCVDSRRPVGKVEGVLQQPSARDAKLLVRSGRLRSIVRRVPASDIDSVGPDRVVLGLERWQFEAKPLYLPDEEVQQAVYDALKAVGPLRYTALRQVEVEVRNGVARLSGHVPTELHRQEAVQVAAAPPGVVKVEDELMTDERLVRAIAVAMLPHPELQPSKITISANLGTVILEGELDSPREVELAAIVAASIPGGPTWRTVFASGAPERYGPRPATGRRQGEAVGWWCWSRPNTHSGATPESSRWIPVTCRGSPAGRWSSSGLAGRVGNRRRSGRDADSVRDHRRAPA
jgi:osmotically-inducible protein OsmY